MSAPTYYSSSLSILVVDDDAIMLRMLEAMLRTDRHTVTVASEVESALEQFKAKPCDLILTDLNLPGKSGEVLAKEIKQFSPATPIIIMTGLLTPRDYEGADVVIRKPFTRATIASAITKCLGDRAKEG